MKPDKQQNPHADIFGNHVSEGLGFVLQQDGSNTNHFYAAYGAGGGKWVMTDAVPLAAGRWQHVAMVKSGDSLRLLLNGVLVAEVQDAATRPPVTDERGRGSGLHGSRALFSRADRRFPHLEQEP